MNVSKLTLQNDLPALQKHFPMLRNDFYPLHNHLPPLHSDLPALRNDLSALQKGFPPLRNDLPMSRNHFPVLRNDFSPRFLACPARLRCRISNTQILKESKGASSLARVKNVPAQAETQAHGVRPRSRGLYESLNGNKFSPFNDIAASHDARVWLLSKL